jgi:hypothetical protein
MKENWTNAVLPSTVRQSETWDLFISTQKYVRKSFEWAEYKRQKVANGKTRHFYRNEYKIICVCVSEWACGKKKHKN